MYDPMKRIHGFYPQSDRLTPSPAHRKPAKKRAKTQRPIPCVMIAHVVSEDDYDRERAKRETGSDRRTACGKAVSEKHARDLAKRFGTGNMLVYVNRDDVSSPFLEIGVTAGCRADGASVVGQWTAIDDDVSAIVRATVYANPDMLWDLDPKESSDILKKLLATASFAKVLVPNLGGSVAKLREDAASYVSSKPLEARYAVLADMFLTLSLSLSVSVFGLQEVGVREMSCGNR